MTTNILVKPSEAKEAIIDCVKSKLVAMMHGSPAIGKSSIVHRIAADFNLKVIDLRLSQCDPTDLLGFPHIENGKASYVPMATFPIAGDPLPPRLDAEGNTVYVTVDGKQKVKTYDGWLLFLDELPIAPPAVQAAAYKLILDRMVGDHHLHSKVAMVGAGNLESDNALVNPMSTALQSRMVHLSLRMDVKEWLEWAMDHNLDFRITSYIAFKNTALYTFKPDHTDHTYASPRTWEFADRILKSVKDINKSTVRPLLSGAVSEGVAHEFLEFCKIENELPKFTSICVDPLSTHVPAEPSVLFLLSGAIASQAEPNNMDNVIKYVMRMPAEFQVVCLREAIKRNMKLMGHAGIQKWVASNGAKLF